MSILSLGLLKAELPHPAFRALPPESSGRKQMRNTHKPVRIDILLGTARKTHFQSFIWTVPVVFIQNKFANRNSGVIK